MLPYVIELFQQLRNPDNIQLDTITTKLTVEQFEAGWKRMKEFTLSGKSGLHFGHLKVCALHTFLSNFESSISHIPFTTGNSLRVWRHTLYYREFTESLESTDNGDDS